MIYHFTLPFLLKFTYTNNRAWCFVRSTKKNRSELKPLEKRTKKKVDGKYEEEEERRSMVRTNGFGEQ